MQDILFPPITGNSFALFGLFEADKNNSNYAYMKMSSVYEKRAITIIIVQVLTVIMSLIVLESRYMYEKIYREALLL